MQAERAAANQTMADLCSRVELKRKAGKRSSCRPEVPSEDPTQSSQKGFISMKCHHLQCLFCIRDERLNFKDRIRTFSQQYTLGRHVENYISALKANGKVICPHPICKTKRMVVNGVEHLKNHANAEHGIRLQIR